MLRTDVELHVDDVRDANGDGLELLVWLRLLRDTVAVVSGDDKPAARRWRGLKGARCSTASSGECGGLRTESCDMACYCLFLFCFCFFVF